MTEYTLPSGNKFIVKECLVEEEKGDVLLEWTYPTLTGGPDDFFYRIRRKAGAQLVTSIVLMQQKIQPGDVFSSIAGLLNFYLVVHAVIVTGQKPIYNILAFNLINTLITFKQKNICRNLYLTIPSTIDKKDFIEAIMLYESQLENFSFIFVVETEPDYKTLNSIFLKMFKKKSSKFFNWYYKLYPKS